MPATTRVSLEEFLARPDIDEHRLELIDGEVTEKVSPTWGHSRIALLLGAALDAFGVAGVEPRAIIPSSPDRAASAPIPDIAFYRVGRPPAASDWMRDPPDVAVEIISPGQSRQAVRAKVDLYLAFGVRSVWVVDPDWRQVDIYELGERRTVSGSEAITSAAVPGFSYAVDQLFHEAERRGP
jgi:Uma2 family endonuclease